MAKQVFKVSKFTNPSGEAVYRLSGTSNGARVRKNFKKREDAVAERQRLMVKHLNEEHEGQTIWTTLTHEQNKDAIAAVSLLNKTGSKRSLTFATQFFLEHFKETEIQERVEEAVEAYLDEKSLEVERGMLSESQENGIKFEFKKFRNYFQGRVVGELLTEDIISYMETPIGRTKANASLKTWNNRRGYLSTFFKFCLSRKSIAGNPIDGVPQRKIKKNRGIADTLTAQRAAEFMLWLQSYRGKQNRNGEWWGIEGCMIPFFVLTLFCGIRPDKRFGEICKLLAKNVRLDTSVVLIDPSVSKTNEMRSVKIQPNVKLWLEKYPLEDFPIMPEKRFKDMWLDVRSQWDLGHDVLRHTFISMTVGAFRSVGDAALQAGNSETVVRKHYLDLKSVEEADQFWRIIPHGTKLPEVLEKKDGRYIPQVVKSGKE